MVSRAAKSPTAATRLNRPPETGPTHWALCPVSGDPVLRSIYGEVTGFN
jgi:hypothetical protein